MGGGSGGWPELSLQLPDTGFSASVLWDREALLLTSGVTHRVQDLKRFQCNHFLNDLEDSLLFLPFTKGFH